MNAESFPAGEHIIYITSHFPYGNGESFLAAEIRALSDIVGDITVVAVRPKSDRPLSAAGVTTHRLSPTFSRETLQASARTLIKYPLKTAALLADLCGSPYRLTAKIKNMLVFLKGLALADFLARRPASMIHAHWLSTPSTIALIAARLLDTPVSFSGHRFDLYADNWLDSKLAACTFVRVISVRGAQDLAQRVFPSLRKRIRTVHVGVELQRNSAKVRHRDPGLSLISVGSLIAVKGHRYLVEALARLDKAGVPFKCTIVGEGRLRPALARLIVQNQLASRVTLRGFVPHEQLLAELASGAFDVMVHPSTETGTLHEGIPVSLMEAMSLQVACIATRTGSIPELLDDSCGVVVEQRDSAALASAIQALSDPALRERLAFAGRERIASSFEAKRCANELVALIRTPLVADTL